MNEGPGASRAQRRPLNPLAKLFMLVLFTILALLITSALYMVLFVSAAVFAKLIFGGRRLLTKGILGFTAAIFIIQVLFSPPGTVMAGVGFIRITFEGMLAGIVIAGRFLCIITMSFIFVSATKPAELYSSLTSVGVPYRYGFVLVLASRFAKIFDIELSTVREAQSIRGLDARRGIRGVINSARHTAFPLLVSALSRVNTLTASMEGRGFGMHEKRTFLRPVKAGWQDTAAILGAVVLFAAVYLADRLLIIF